MINAINDFFGLVNGFAGGILFFDMAFFTDKVSLPFAVLWLTFAAVFFSIKMRFPGFRLFKHAIDITRGKYDRPTDKGEVSHFAALAMALSATVGLGNIAGVAVAVSLGGPGATFWMILAGLLGMTLKFTECTLGQIYRETRPDGHVLGGPMEYLEVGLKEKGYKHLGKVLAVLFALLCIGGSLAGGSSFQVNQSLAAIRSTVPFLDSFPWVYGLLMSFLVGIVIIGGIRRIAEVAGKVVPFMCIIYVLTAIYILGSHASLIPWAFGEIIRGAFSPDAAYGGMVGVIIMGFQRAAFSNEAGIGSAAIAHSAAKTEYPVQEGIVALLEPFIDTVMVCTMTALIIIITGVYNSPDYAILVETRQGAALTSAALGAAVSWFPYILSASVFLFAFSTMISWSYYGERCTVYLLSEKYSIHYKVILLIVIFLGAISTADNVFDFGDLMVLGMAVPNLLGVYLLAGKAKEHLDDYCKKLKSGEIKPQE